MDEQPHRTVTRVTKNIAAQIIALASTTVSKLLITIVIGRLFGVQQVGEFAFVMTLSLMFTFLSTCGMPWALIREVATHRDRAKQYAENGLTIVSISGLATIPLMVITAWLLRRPATTCIAVGLAGLALVFDGLAQTVCAVFNGFERMEMASLVTIVQEIAFLVAGTIALVLRLPLLWLFVVYVPSRLAGFLVSLPLYHKLMGCPLRFGWDGSLGRELLHLTVPYAANMALGPIYLRIDVVMLTFYHGNAAAGLYEAATSIFYRFNVFARTINNALMPAMARAFGAEDAHGLTAHTATTYINTAVKYQVAMGMPFSVACVVLADPLISVLYGQEFAPSATVFRLLATIITLRFIDNTLATALTASGMQSSRSIAVACSALFNVAINLFVLPVYSFTGAAVTTILTEICFFALLYLHLARRVPRSLDGERVRLGEPIREANAFARTNVRAQGRRVRNEFARLWLRPAIAGAGMALVCWLWQANKLATLFTPLQQLSTVARLSISLFSGTTAYLILLFALGTFSRQEIRVVRIVWQRTVRSARGLLKPRHMRVDRPGSAQS